MASYTNTKKNEIKTLIDAYTEKELDNFVRHEIKEVAINAMNKGESAQNIADMVFDTISLKYSGNQYMAAACQQICPKSTLLVLRNEIIKTLK